MHKNAKMQMYFRVFIQSFCGKFKLSAGSGSQVSQLLECMIQGYLKGKGISLLRKEDWKEVLIKRQI